MGTSTKTSAGRPRLQAEPTPIELACPYCAHHHTMLPLDGWGLFWSCPNCQKVSTLADCVVALKGGGHADHQ